MEPQAPLRRLHLIQKQLTSTNASNSADPLVIMGFDRFFDESINAKRMELRRALEQERGRLNDAYEQADTSDYFKQLFKKLNLGSYQTWQEQAALNYETSRVDASFALSMGVQLYLVIDTIKLLGSEAQKAKYLPGMTSGDLYGCWCLSEPDAGSDASNLELDAKPVEGGYCLNGYKKWSGNTALGQVIIVFARHSVGGNIIGLLVNLQTEGVKYVNIKHKLAHRGTQNALIEFRNVFVPAEDKLEKANDFVSGPEVILERSRLRISWLSVGTIAGVYEGVVTRLSQAKSVRNIAVVRAKLNRMLSLFTSCFLMVSNLVQQSQKTRVTVAHTSLVKAEASRQVAEATRLASDILEEQGLTLDNIAAKSIADTETIITGEGSYEISVLVAGRELTGLASFKVPS
mmetsp:Transcript_7747/g.14702  ORF Transcript_7747/g.14702 Transcript_7747/m.14702 type:complete len:403 (-) Transcript_7747:6156-7364(-)